MLQQTRRRIMIVDDEQCIADTLAVILRGSGYEATAYYEGRSALEACAGNAPDLLISDVVMPGISGIELAHLILEICPECRILLFSGLSASFDRVQEAKRAGRHFEILEKPIPPAELLEKVAASFRRGSPVPLPAHSLRTVRNSFGGRTDGR